MSGLFSNDRQDLRQSYLDAWQKHLDKKILSPLENQIVEVILLHPEYQALLNENNLNKTYLPEMGEANPFLHMGLHLAIREQINTDRPVGICQIYASLCQHHAKHDVEHKMLECLAETLWQAQRDQRQPDEVKYLEKLKTLD